ncbi:MAG: sterol carrier protein domain-containing protein, partial [Planctomycetes bacterium]|nr:sterol carrier protein domain-containing protein [Planctomycetota bacterium]
PTGYMVYTIRDDVMHIKEIINTDMEAWKGLWKFISAHDSMVDAVRGDNYSSEPIAFWLEDSDIKETIRPYIMGRIVDVMKFISHYRFVTIKRSECITFRVRDDFLEWNNQTFSLCFRTDGGVDVVSGAIREPVELDIGALTTILIGYQRPSSLCRLERISIDSDSLTLLENIVPNQKPYISDYI